MSEKIGVKCRDCDNICFSESRYIKISTTRFGGFRCKLCRIKYKKEMGRKDSLKRRLEGQEIIQIKCKYCGNLTNTKKYKEKQYLKKGGIVCQKCINKISSIRLKKIRDSQTPERRKEIAKLSNAGRTKESKSLAVKKQWETFRKSPEKWAEICKAKSERMKKVWREYPDEVKNHIVDAFCKSFGKSRSTSSDLLKNKMIESGVYDGFVSEEVFHGFVPDEINHSLKIIVEMYGDLYHCNPKKYKDPKQYITALQRTVEEQWQRDRRRLACFYKHGYSVVVVWDSDFRNYPDREIERIRNEIKRKKET